MNEVVVENTMPEIKTWNGQRVVTFKDIDTVHGRKNGDASRNFRNNKKHFNLNEDYYVLTKEQCNGKILPIGNIPPKGLTLLTETGYLMIVKSFTDDLSWEVQRRLVNSYFKVNEQTSITTTNPCALTKNKTKTWSEKNFWKFQKICKDMDWEMKYLHHKILSEVSDLWNLDFFKNCYFDKHFHEPKYNMDLINEFPDLQTMAEKYLDYLMDAFGDME